MMRWHSCNHSLFLVLIVGVAAALLVDVQRVRAQESETPEQTVRRLSAAVDQAQAQVEASQEQLAELRRSLAALQERLGTKQAAAAEGGPTETHANVSAGPAPASSSEQSERQAMQQSQIATLNQIKVESSSKYPVSIHGLILLNGFVNSSAVDIPLAPSVAVSGAGTTGASLRQTSFGVDARGPTLGGGRSHADFDIDFLGNAAGPVTATSTGFVRLRTAHAALDWQHTQAFFRFDHTLLNPNAPTSLVANAQPPLAWSGNLWQWVPQAGVTHMLTLGGARTLQIGGALIDVPDPPALTTSATSAAGAAEQSRKPGGEMHLELAKGQGPPGASFGVGGYLSPHRDQSGLTYDAWAATVDERVPLPSGFLLTGSVYRGLALGGLGGGAYKDVVSQQRGSATISRPLDAVGGWVQAKKRAGERLEFNAALGLDEAFAKELRAFSLNDSLYYGNLARNRSVTGNVIWSPSAYLLFSFEYHRISSYLTNAPTIDNNAFGIAAGYRF